MKNLSVITLLAILLVSCAPASTPAPVNTVTDALESTFVLIRTATNTQLLTATVTPKPKATKLPTQTPTKSITPTSSPTTTITSTPSHPVGRVIFHQADEKIAYNWFSYVPRNLSKTDPVYILITGIRAEVNDEYDKFTDIAKDEIQWRSDLAERYGYILLTPHIPRPKTNHIYVAAFDRKVFLSSTNEFYQRPDLKINFMIDELTNDLRQDGFNVQDKVFVEGHSIGGMFAQRYAILHPHRIKAIAAGAPGGTLTLPEGTFNGIEMAWPVGISDISKLTGTEFDREVYEKIPQFYYIGEIDDNTTLWGIGELWQTYSQINFIKDNFGRTPADILENQSAYLEKLGYEITFKKYPGIGHNYTDAMIRDYFAFFANYR